MEAMDKQKQRKLDQAGWRVGTVTNFLGLSPEEETFVEIRLRLVHALRLRRRLRKLSQVELANRLGSSQSRVAKMEAGDQSVSIDLLLRGLLALGATSRDVAKVFQDTSPLPPLMP